MITAAALVIKGMDGTIEAKEVIYNFERQMKVEGVPANLLKCSEFGAAVVRYM